MSIDVDNAVATRWDAVSALTNIAELYPGESAPTPETDGAMPRCNYFSDSDLLESESRGTHVKQKIYTFEAWGTTWEAVGGYVRTIRSNFLLSERSASNGLQMDSSRGKILSTHEAGQGIEKLSDQVFRGYYMLMVRYEQNKVVP